MASDLRVESSPVGPVVYPPRAAEMTILYLHGDQDISAGPESTLDTARYLARHAEATVVCCRYRSALPAALEDVHAAYQRCQDIGPVAVVGERLGAGLAAALLVHLRDSGAAQPRRAVLVSALLDLTMQARSLALNASTDPSFDVIALRRRVADYAGGAPLTDSKVNPLYANLHGLPPIQILAAGTDPQLDDSLSFAARAAHDRVPVDMRIWPDATGCRDRELTAMAAFLTTRHPKAPSEADSARVLAG